MGPTATAYTSVFSGLIEIRTENWRPDRAVLRVPDLRVGNEEAQVGVDILSFRIIPSGIGSEYSLEDAGGAAPVQQQNKQQLRGDQTHEEARLVRPGQEHGAGCGHTDWVTSECFKAWKGSDRTHGCPYKTRPMPG